MDCGIQQSNAVEAAFFKQLLGHRGFGHLITNRYSQEQEGTGNGAPAVAWP